MRCRVLISELVISVLAHSAALGQQVLSDLPLAGSFTDGATGQTAAFSRPSPAYGPDATLFPPGAPRFEIFAVATRAVVDVRTLPNSLVPVALLPNMLIAAGGMWIYGSTDGQNFVPRGPLPYPLRGQESAFGTPAGSLLVWLEDGQLWRSTDAGQTFVPVLQFPPYCYPLHWNFAALGTTIFVSEYGDVNQPDNPRRIYRSWDDGATWSVVYSPPAQIGYHNHKIVADPSTGRIYQSHGDTTHGVLCSPDLGETWTLLHDYYQPTDAITRPGAIYWGHDGGGAVSVQRLDTSTGLWTWPLQPWRGYVGDYSRTGNILAMADYAGVMYAGITLLDELWASQDGLRWALVAGPYTGSNGGEDFVGAFAGVIHGRARQTLNYLRITPPGLANLTGLRLEPGFTNRIDSGTGSSFEGGLTGCNVTPPATVDWDSGRSFHGQASARWTIPGGTAAMIVKLAPVPAALPVGTHLYGQVRVMGDELPLLAFLMDEAHNLRGPLTVTSARDEWGLVRVEMTVTQPDNSVRLMIEAGAASNPVTIWLDGYQIAALETGSTWQLGGAPRAAEHLTLPVAFPASWTDVVYVKPDFGCGDASAAPRTLKAWVQDADHYTQLVFDSSAVCFKLREVVAGNVTELCASPRAEVWPGWTCRIGVRSGPGGADFRIVIGTTEVVGAGPALTVQPVSLWIGSSPAGNDGAPGVYALSRTFAGRLPDAAIRSLLNFLPGVAPPAADCNGNGVDDAEDIASGTSQDMDWDGVPDECEADCNQNGQPDDYDIANGAPDCNGNGRPDSCDLLDGTSQDANGNGIPDECDPDCNGNGVPDDLDILNGTSQDLNGDGLPDECTPLTGDLNCDGTVNFGDINPFVLRLSNLAGYRAIYPICPNANGDINGDGTVNFGDINPFVALLINGGRPNP
jgi:hypothetical protein